MRAGGNHPTCSSCLADIASDGKKSFLGFGKVSCESCGHVNTLPLTGGYRATYFVVFGLMVILMMNASSKGQSPMPGFIGVLVTIALVRDFYLRWRLSRQG